MRASGDSKPTLNELALLAPRLRLVLTFERDVLAHLPDHVLHDQAFPLALVEVELLDDPLEARAAQNLLADHVQSLPKFGGHRRLDEFSGTRCGTIRIDVDAR